MKETGLGSIRREDVENRDGEVVKAYSDVMLKASKVHMSALWEYGL